MKKFGLSLLTALLLSSMATAQEQDFITYHSCDFTDKIPSDYATYDLDEQTLHYTMVQGGIKQGQAWARKKESGKDNYYAVSACRYKEIEGTELQPSDDWLITPRIWIRGNNATLSWRAISIKNLLTVGAGYEVLISTTGNTPDDFTQEPVFAITEEPINEWSTHTIDLSNYQGQHIYIAFRNNSAQGEFLGIDDIHVSGHRGVCNFTVTNGSHIFGQEALEVSTAITSYNDSPITDITFHYTHNGNTVTQTVNNLNIEKYQTYNFTFDTPIPCNTNDTLHYTVGATVNGIEIDEIDCSTVVFAFQTTRRTVVEEATGMWCVYCPAGIVAMEILQEKYPDQFIGLALHKDDPLAVNEYISDLGFPEGFPTAWVNRTNYVIDIMVEVDNNGTKEMTPSNGGIETVFLAAKDIITTTDIKINSTAIDNNSMTVNCSIRPAIDIPNATYQLALAIVEDDVWQDGYFQANKYSGGDVKMFGWEDLPSSITSDFAFQHVVHAIYDNYQGISGSIPTHLTANTEYTYTHTIELPAAIKNLDNTKVVAMIIDTTTGEIINANQQYALAAVDNISTPSTRCYAVGRTVHISSPTPARITIYNMAGNIVSQHTTTHDTSTIDIDNTGIYLVTIQNDNNTTTHKVIVR